MNGAAYEEEEEAYPEGEDYEYEGYGDYEYDYSAYDPSHAAHVQFYSTVGGLLGCLRVAATY